MASRPYFVCGDGIKAVLCVMMASRPYSVCDDGIKAMYSACVW